MADYLRAQSQHDAVPRTFRSPDQ